MAQKIAVNTRLLLKNNVEGIGRYSYEILKRITCSHPETEFIFLFDRKFHKDFIFGQNVKGRVIYPHARHPLIYNLWFQRAIKKTLKLDLPDLFFSPEGYTVIDSKIKSVNVMHDLNFMHHPEEISKRNFRHFKTNFPEYARSANRIITVSEYSKRDIQNQFGISPEKIEVVYNGASDIFNPLNESEKTEIRDKWTNGAPYFVFVGSMLPRKNLDRLLKAFENIKQRLPDGFKLVLAGSKKYWSSKLQNQLVGMQHREDVIFTDWIEDSELCKIVGAATALTYIPYFEGFGLPIVEAFKSGIPVITSNVTSLPEIASNAALMVDPLNVLEIEGAMLKLINDPDLQTELIGKGFDQVKQFTWDKSAGQTWEILMKVINET